MVKFSNCDNHIRWTLLHMFLINDTNMLCSVIHKRTRRNIYIYRKREGVLKVDEEPEMDWKSEKQSETDPAKSHPDESPWRKWMREEPGWSHKPSIDRGGDRRGGDPVRTKEAKTPGDTRGPKGRGAKVEPGAPEVAPVGSEDWERAGGKEEPNGAKGVEGWGITGAPEVHGIGRATTDQDRARGTREPGGAGRTMVPIGGEGGRGRGWQASSNEWTHCRMLVRTNSGTNKRPSWHPMGTMSEIELGIHLRGCVVLHCAWVSSYDRFKWQKGLPHPLTSGASPPTPT